MIARLRSSGLVVAWLALAGCDEPPARLLRRGLPTVRSAHASVDVPPPADADLDRSPGRVAGHPLFVPPSFVAPTGAYDVALHFHGAPPVVRAAYARAAIASVVVVVNVGTGSAPYQQLFLEPARLGAWLDALDDELGRRGLRGAHRRRVALSAWSAGYGAILQILQRSEARPEVDAVVLLDGLHSRRDGPSIASAPLAPFAAFAREAQRGDKLFVLSHSRVVPEGDTASVYRCADWLLRDLDVPRFGRYEVLPAIATEPSAPEMRLESEAREEGLVVRGFAGSDASDHMAHLRQMAAVALDELRGRWSKSDDAPNHGGDRLDRGRLAR